MVVAEKKVRSHFFLCNIIRSRQLIPVGGRAFLMPLKQNTFLPQSFQQGDLSQSAGVLRRSFASLNLDVSNKATYPSRRGEGASTILKKIRSYLVSNKATYPSRRGFDRHHSYCVAGDGAACFQQGDLSQSAGVTRLGLNNSLGSVSFQQGDLSQSAGATLRTLLRSPPSMFPTRRLIPVGGGNIVKPTTVEEAAFPTRRLIPVGGGAPSRRARNRRCACVSNKATYPSRRGSVR